MMFLPASDYYFIERDNNSFDLFFPRHCAKKRFIESKLIEQLLWQIDFGLRWSQRTFSMFLMCVFTFVVMYNTGDIYLDVRSSRISGWRLPVRFPFFPQKCAAPYATHSGTTVLRDLQFLRLPVHVPTRHSSIIRPLSEYRGSYEIGNFTCGTVVPGKNASANRPTSLFPGKGESEGKSLGGTGGQCDRSHLRIWGISI